MKCYHPAAYWKIAHFHFPLCREFIRGMDEDTSVSRMVGDMLNPQDPSSDTILLAGERTHTTFSFIMPICHPTIWLAVTSVLCGKVSLTPALSCLSPFCLNLNVCVCVCVCVWRESFRVVIYCTGLVSFVERCLAVTPISLQRSGDTRWRSPLSLSHSLTSPSSSQQKESITLNLSLWPLHTLSWSACCFSH